MQVMISFERVIKALSDYVVHGDVSVHVKFVCLVVMLLIL
jgi:hypothetical protein